MTSVLRVVMRDRPLRLIVLAGPIASLAHGISAIGLVVYAYRAGGAAAVTVFYVIRLVPSALVTPFSAALADRYARQRVLLASSCADACLRLLIAVLVLRGAPVIAVAATAGLLAVSITPVQPAQVALISARAAGSREFVAANALLNTGYSLSLLTGPALGGLLLAGTSLGTTFLVGAALAGIAAYAVARVPVDPRPTPDGRAISSGLFGSFGAVFASPSLRLLVVLICLNTAVVGALNVLFVVAGFELIGVGPTGVGLLLAALGLGGLVGGLPAVGVIARTPARAFVGAMLVSGIAVSFIGLWSVAAATFAFAFVFGIANGIIDVADLTLIQRAVPDSLMARTVGLVTALIYGAFTLGAVLAPILVAAAGTRLALGRDRGFGAARGSCFVPATRAPREGRARSRATSSHCSVTCRCSHHLMR